MENKQVILFVGITSLVSVLLSGCAPERAFQPIPSTTTNTTQPATPSPSPSSTALTSVAMDKTCDSIFPVDGLYKFDPNVALAPDSSPFISSPVVSEQQALKGISCKLLNLSSGATTQVVVVKLQPESAKQLTQSIATDPNSVPYQVNTELRGTYNKQIGQFVKGNYWVTVSSAGFQNPVDASKLSYLTSLGLN